MNLAVVAYATAGPYEQELLAMAESFGRALVRSQDTEPLCFRFLLPVLKSEVCPNDDWAAATSYKPTFLLSALDFFSQGRADWLLYVDADARFRQLSRLASTLRDMQSAGEDIGVHYLKHPDGTKELISATILFRVCARIRCRFQAWERLCKDRPDVWDQKHLQSVLETADAGLVRMLPPEWCWIDGGFKPRDISASVYGDNIEPYIVQTQASRRLKRVKSASDDMEETT
jgi:hypothetical protein